MVTAKSYRPVDRDQEILLPPSMIDWLPEDHLVWLVIAEVDRLDTASFHFKARLGGVGRRGYDPDMLLTLFIYAMAHGESSSRRIERLCHTDARTWTGDSEGRQPNSIVIDSRGDHPMMYRRVLVTGATAVVIVGAGTAALATTGSNTTTGTPTPSTTAAPHHKKAAKKGDGKLLRRAVHAQIVTKGKDGTFVTHDLITGTVTAVSSTSITVQAADKTSETFVVDAATKVRLRTNGKGAASTISKVAAGDTVLAAGTGTTTLTAKHLVDRGK